jgi:flap endonuclease-1
MFCAELAIGGQTAATFSTDSDCLALGVPFFFDSITGTKKGKGGFIKGTVLGPILDELGLSMQEFRDFCIILGSDFNDRIPGYGPAKGYKLITEYRSIEKIADSGIDVTPLNYERTRHLLTPKDRNWNEFSLDINFEMFETLGPSVLEQYMLTDLYKELSDSIKTVKNVRYGLDD